MASKSSTSITETDTEPEPEQEKVTGWGWSGTGEKVDTTPLPPVKTPVRASQHVEKQKHGKNEKPAEEENPEKPPPPPSKPPKDHHHKDDTHDDSEPDKSKPEKKKSSSEDSSDDDDKASAPPPKSKHKPPPKPAPKPPPPEKKKVPPPLIGPDGKEIPRPKDSDGKPIRVYVDKNGRAVLDRDGHPFPLRYDKDGNPLPMDYDAATGKPPEYKAAPPPPKPPPTAPAPVQPQPSIQPSIQQQPSMQQTDTQKEPVPACLSLFAYVNAILTILVAAYAGYEYSFYYDQRYSTTTYVSYSEQLVLEAVLRGTLATIIISVLAAFMGLIDCLSVNKFRLVLLWNMVAVVFLVAQLLAWYLLTDWSSELNLLFGISYAGVRLFLVLFACCCAYEAETPTTSDYNYTAAAQAQRSASTYKPVKDTSNIYTTAKYTPPPATPAAPVTTYVQPTVPTTYVYPQTTMYTPAYGYPYGGYGMGYGMGYGGMYSPFFGESLYW